MLAGLATVVLPVVAHLLSKRRYDVVDWGAMQFLQLGQRTRRRIRLQDLLLLFLRMLLLACLVFALARPYGQGAIFAKLANRTSRDIVFIIDGSGSMGWEGPDGTPHAAAIQWVHDALEDLNPGDTVAVIDARFRNRWLVHPATSSTARVRAALDQIPAPTGTSNLVEAVLEAVRLLATTQNTTREVILLTDGQALPWQIDDEFGFQRIDDLLSQPDVIPSIAVVNLSDSPDERANCSVGNIELSRELTVPGFPIRFRTTIRQSGGLAAQKEVSLAVNGQPAPESTRNVSLLPNGEAVLEFEQVFPVKGFYRVSLAIEADQLPQDDFSEAIVVVEDGVPVLLVDGDPKIDETQTETFFLASAFSASGEEAKWVKATTVPPGGFTTEALAQSRVVFLCNVPELTRQQQLALVDFVVAGGGVVFAPGEITNPAHWNQFLLTDAQPFLPAELLTIETAVDDPDNSLTIDSLSLESPWLAGFKKETGVDLWTSRFSRYWELKPFVETSQPAGNATEHPTLQNTVVARLVNGKPFLVSKQLGDGTILQLAAPLDADWSTLPARNDFVPFVHEMVFRLSSFHAPHNVEVGMPLQIELEDEERARDFSVDGPGISQAIPESNRSGRKRLAVFSETAIPGRYHFEKKSAPLPQQIPFIVSDDRKEADLTPLDDLGWETLLANDRMQLINEMGDLTRQIQSKHSQTELWWLVLLMLLILLTCEVALTRKMLREGHADLTELPPQELAHS